MHPAQGDTEYLDTLLMGHSYLIGYNTQPDTGVIGLQGHLTQLYSQGHGVSSNSSNHGVWGRLKGHLTGPASRRTELRYLTQISWDQRITSHILFMRARGHLTGHLTRLVHRNTGSPHNALLTGIGHPTNTVMGSYDHLSLSNKVMKSLTRHFLYAPCFNGSKLRGSPHRALLIGPQGHFTGQLNQPFLDLCQAHHPAQVSISMYSPSGLGYLQC